MKGALFRILQVLLITIFITILIGVGTIAFADKASAGTRPPAPDFFLFDLKISPEEADIGQVVTISATLMNRGDLAGSIRLVLMINGVEEATQDYTVDILERKAVSFTTSKNTAGRYSVELYDLTGSFSVREKAATPTIPIVIGIIGALILAALVIFFYRKKFVKKTIG